MGHDWPGNVRELENVIHRSLLVASETELTLDDLPPELGGPAPATSEVAQVSDGFQTLEEMEKRTIRRALEVCDGNLSDAARRLGIGRSTLYRKMDQYSLKS